MSEHLPPLPESVEKAIVQEEGRAAIRLAIRRALAEEREACAWTCDQLAEIAAHAARIDESGAAVSCGQHIRARPTEPTT